LRRAEALLHGLLPGVDLNDPNLESTLHQGRMSVQMPSAPLSSAQTANGVYHSSSNAPTSEDTTDTTDLQSMVKSTGQLDLDEEGHWDYHGHSSGLSFVRKFKSTFGDIKFAEGQGTPFIKSRPMSAVFDSPRSAQDSPMDINQPMAELPSKDIALQLCDLAINDASSLLRVVHAPTFFAKLDHLYETIPDNYSNEDHTFLPLLYAVLALGTLFSKTEDGELDRKGYGEAIDRG